MKDGFRKTILIMVAALSALTAGLYLWLTLGHPFAPTKAQSEAFAAHVKGFDSNRWKQLVKEDSNEPERQWMVDDLLRRKKLVGMSRAQIDELLSKPPPTGYFKDYEYVYWLGPERGVLQLDSEWLGLKFRNNCVVEARLLTD